MSARPHVSDALVQLKRWVLLCVLCVCVACVAQVLVFGVVHYTEARWAAVEQAPVPKNLNVVAAPSVPEPAKAIVNHSPTAIEKPARSLSNTDGILRAASGIASTAGLMSMACMALLTMLGVVVAAGGNVPGMHLTVRACVWSIVLALACVPWASFVPNAALPGVFASYDVITTQSELTHATSGELALHVRMVVMPLLALVLCPLAGWWFRQGVAAGYVFTHVSEMEEALQREMNVVRERGATSMRGGVNRAGAAMSMTLGAPPEPQAAPVLKKAAGAESLSDVSPALLRDLGRPMGSPDAGDAPKRPI